jgi:hypothetical protein
VRLGNLWYQGPTIYDESLEWFICFDDDEPPEIVVKSSGQLSKIHRKEKIEHFLRNADINARIINHEVCGSRLFPPDWKQFYPAIRAFIEIQNKIDVTNLKVKHDGISPDLPPVGEYVAYDFCQNEMEIQLTSKNFQQLSRTINPFNE